MSAIIRFQGKLLMPDYIKSAQPSEKVHERTFWVNALKIQMTDKGVVWFLDLVRILVLAYCPIVYTENVSGQTLRKFQFPTQELEFLSGQLGGFLAQGFCYASMQSLQIVNGDSFTVWS